jgi:hypothetical protein
MKFFGSVTPVRAGGGAEHRTRLHGRQRRTTVRDPGTWKGSDEHRTCLHGRQGRTTVRDPDIREKGITVFFSGQAVQP